MGQRSRASHNPDPTDPTQTGRPIAPEDNPHERAPVPGDSVSGPPGERPGPADGERRKDLPGDPAPRP